MKIALNNDAPHNFILALAQSFIISRVIIWFVECGALSLFKKKTSYCLDELSEQLVIDKKTLMRFLRLLSAYQIIICKDDKYALNESLECLAQLQALQLSNLYSDIGQIIDKMQAKVALSDQEQDSLSVALTYALEAKDELSHAVFAFVIARLVIYLAQNHFEEIFVNKISLDQFAKQLKLPIHISNQIVSLLAYHHIIIVDQHTIYSTPLAAALPWVLTAHITDAYHVFNKIGHTLTVNEAAWMPTYGANFYNYLNQHIDKLKEFKDWCELSAISWFEAVLLWCHFPNANKLVDIGGGAGIFLQNILRKNPHISGTLFEKKIVVDNIDTSQFSDCADRMQLVAGDFFEINTIPDDGDIYIICRTLLNWSDEEVVIILNNCAKAMPANGKIIIIDFLIPQQNHSKYQRAVLNDISLFTIVNSAIRTQEEWSQIIDKTHLKIASFQMTDDKQLPIHHMPYYPMCFIELVLKR